MHNTSEIQSYVTLSKHATLSILLGLFLLQFSPPSPTGGQPSLKLYLAIVPLWKPPCSCTLARLYNRWSSKYSLLRCLPHVTDLVKFLLHICPLWHLASILNAQTFSDSLSSFWCLAEYLAYSMCSVIVCGSEYQLLTTCFPYSVMKIRKRMMNVFVNTCIGQNYQTDFISKVDDCFY